jgi:hypothetical protein
LRSEAASALAIKMDGKGAMDVIAKTHEWLPRRKFVQYLTAQTRCTHLNGTKIPFLEHSLTARHL